MNLVGLMRARNESWCIGASLRIALRWCDSVVVLLHACVDDTPDIVQAIEEEHPGRVYVLIERKAGWSEMSDLQRLLEESRKLKATHIGIVDCDEVLAGNLLSTVREHIEHLPPGGVLHVPMPAMWRSLDQYRVGQSIWANRFDLALAFADRPDLNWAPKNGYDHHCREPIGSTCARRGYGMNGGTMHLQWASWRRLVAKHALYKISERIKYPDKPVHSIDRMYSLALDETGLQVKDAPAEWWAPYQRLRSLIDLNAEPWQEAEAKRLWTVHGADAFRGLNLFGVVGEPVPA